MKLCPASRGLTTAMQSRPSLALGRLFLED